ncbi:hypothetical protein SpCBS45565_g01585 [Spizellomyces sp. 'palustris']|nr:hypothetical protein SpCBS45565_g01585 [Spizellomyces sp. 'palustris']
MAAAHTRLISAHGAVMEFPEHLMDMSEEGAEEIRPAPGARALPGMARQGGARGANGSHMQKGKVNRRPVTAVFDNVEPESFKIRRLYLQLEELRLKCSTNATTVVCRIQIGSQSHNTATLSLRKEANKGFGLIAHPKEGFIFDTEDQDIRVTIRLHSVPANARSPNDFSPHLSTSPSFDCVPTAADPTVLRPKLGLLSNLRRSPTSSSMGFNAFNGSGTSTPSGTAPDAGQLLGELTFGVPGRASVGTKIPAEYMAMSPNGKKEIAKINMQMGVFLDEEYCPEPEPEPIPAEPEFVDYLNFLIHTTGASIWRKYWCILRENELQIFDFEYRETKPVYALPLHQIGHVHPADPELMCAPYCIEMIFNSSYVAQPGAGWFMSILENKPGSTDVVSYMTADSKQRMVGWMDEIAREKARMAGAGTPVPPPRKATAPKGSRKPVASVSAIAMAREAAY